jgi:hypothetical protein
MAPAAADVPTPRFRPHDYEESAKDLVDSRAKATREEPATPLVVPSTTILVSSFDRRIMVLDNGEIVAEGLATIAEPGKALGHHVFVLSKVDQADGQLRWNALGYAQSTDPYVAEADLGTIQRIRAPHEVVEAIRTRMYPGTMMVTVDQPLLADTRSTRDFTVVTSEIG